MILQSFSKTVSSAGNLCRRWPQVVLLLLTSLFDGASQALDYVAKKHAGFMLFTIFHSSVRGGPRDLGGPFAYIAALNDS